MEKTKILIVEDEDKIATIVRTYAEKEGYEVQVAGDGKEAIRKFEFFDPHLVLLDRMLPEISGEEVLKWIKKRKAVPVIMVTARSMEPDILDGYGRGADDYVTKPFSPRVLMARIRAVLKRSTQPGFRDVLRTGAYELHPQDQTWRGREKSVPLSHREFEILYLLASHPGRIFSREMILDLVFGEEEEAFDRAVDSHIKNIRKKIEKDPSHPVLLITVYGSGYKFSERP
ncbi:MAG TPA: response regulator transcription factor [Candidatus Mcinerneyibacteriales bacterium]|nr:response regulator transcription factor [Candidatus Mcinerneyibacteriales bacterium]